MSVIVTYSRRIAARASESRPPSSEWRPASDEKTNVSGLVVVPSSSSHAEAVERLITAVQEHGLAVLARVDHAAGARAAGLELAGEEVVLFGNATAGTPLMQSDPRVGIDLPLRMLVWEGPDGTRLAYHDPRELAQAYDLAGREQVLERMNDLLAALAAAAAG
jgi:uncharacterized protein (DUF302 family)